MTQIVSQKAPWDPGTFSVATVQSRTPTCNQFPIAVSSPVRFWETCSYDETLSHLGRSTVCHKERDILHHLLRLCATEGNLTRGREIHNHVKERGLQSDPVLGSQLVQMYDSLGSLSEAHQVFNDLPEPDLISWTTIISAHVTHGENHEALRLYSRLQDLNIGLDGPVYMAALKACAGAAAVEEGKLIHAHIIENGWESATFVGNTLVVMYAKCGSLEEAVLTLNRLPQHDIVSWNALLSGYSELGFCRQGVELFKQMRDQKLTLSHVSFIFVLKSCASLLILDEGEQVHSLAIEYGLNNDVAVCNGLIEMYANCGCLLDASLAFERIGTPDVALWSTLIAAYGNAGQGNYSLELFCRMQRENVIPNAITYNCVLKACTSIAYFEEGKRIHTLIVTRGYDSNALLGCTLIDMYCESMDLDQAYSVFNMCVDHDVSLWNSMIGGYAQHGLGKEALQMFLKMKQKGMEANKITIMYSLKACSSVCALDQGRRLHAQALSHGFLWDLQVVSSVIDMYGKCGALQDAAVAFEGLHKRDVTAWNIIIAGSSQHSDYNKAYGYFKAMQKAGFLPDEVTYLCLLAACSRLGMAGEGLCQFKSLVMEEDIAPTSKLFVSMVDCLGRAGFLKEAEDLIESLPYHADEAGWLSLLGSCRLHADEDVGSRCFNNILKVNPKNATAFVFMESLYRHVGMEEQAEKILKCRGDSCAWKKPAKAFIEVDSVVHDFIVGDQSHPCSSEIYAKMKDIIIKMKEEGCMPSSKFIDYDAGEEAITGSDQDFRPGHCEKLAIAFGLISTPVGSTIRVSKNLRMCNNCHDVTKFISRSEVREIIVNDAFCVHHFKNGVCSCNDLF